MLAKELSPTQVVSKSNGLCDETGRHEFSDASALFRRLLVPIGPPFDCHPPSCPILDLVKMWKSEVALLCAEHLHSHSQADSTVLSRLVGQLENAGSPQVQVISSADRPTLAVETAIRECGSSLVIMSPTLYESPAPWFGTVLQRLIRRPPAPLLVMKSHQPLAPQAILCVVEESEPSVRAIRLTASLARSVSSRITFLTVVPAAAVFPTDETTVWDFHSRQHGQRSLASLPSLNLPPSGKEAASVVAGQPSDVPEQILTECDLAGLDYETRIVAGSPSVQVALLARSRQCGLIVTGAAPRSGFTCGFPRNAAEAITEASNLPVLVVP